MNPDDIHKWEFIKEDKYHETWRSEYCGEIQVQKALAEHIRNQSLHHQLQKAREESRWQTIDELKFISDKLNELDFTRILYQYEMSRQRNRSELYQDKQADHLPDRPLNYERE